MPGAGFAQATGSISANCCPDSPRMAAITWSVAVRVSKWPLTWSPEEANLMGGPKAMLTLRGLGSLAPRGKARSVPVIPAGMTGTPDSSATLDG